MARRHSLNGPKLLKGRQRGDAIVEYILVLPILLMILFGILEMGRVLDAWIVVQNAAREGARSGALATSANISTAAQQAADPIGSATRDYAGTRRELHGDYTKAFPSMHLTYDVTPGLKPPV